MQKIIFYTLLNLSLLFYGCSENKPLEVGQKTTMEIDSVFNAGTVVKGEIIHATFKVRNTGDYPLVFGEVRASCGCTVPSKPQKPIQPGETSQITAEVNTANLTSKQIIKSVTTMSNTEPNIHLLEIKAKIK
jgi:hypothetical protein